MTETEALIAGLGVRLITRSELVVDDAQRRVWLASLKRFKQGLKVRAKLGVLQGYCQQVAAQRTSGLTWEQPDWESAYWRDKLYDAIAQGQWPEDLLLGFAQSIGRFYYTQKNPRVVDYLPTVENILKQQSIALRLRFGALCRRDDGGNQEATQEVPSGQGAA